MLRAYYRWLNAQVADTPLRVIAILSYLPYLWLFRTFVGRPFSVVDTGNPYAEVVVSIALTLAGAFPFALLVVHTYVLTRHFARRVRSKAFRSPPSHEKPDP